MRYVEARLETEERDDAYRFYVSDGLWCAMNERRLDKRFIELIGKLEPEPQKSGEEIVADVIERAGLKLGV